VSPTWADPVYCLSVCLFGAAGEGVPAQVGEVQAAGLVMVQSAGDEKLEAIARSRGPSMVEKRS